MRPEGVAPHLHPLLFSCTYSWRAAHSDSTWAEAVTDSRLTPILGNCLRPLLAFFVQFSFSCTYFLALDSSFSILLFWIVPVIDSHCMALWITSCHFDFRHVCCIFVFCFVCLFLFSPLSSTPWWLRVELCNCGLSLTECTTPLISKLIRSLYG